MFGEYDTTKLLTIDPLILYSTYLGGSLSDEAYSITVDDSGHAHVAGRTSSTDFPATPGAFQAEPHGLSDCTVVKTSGLCGAMK